MVAKDALALLDKLPLWRRVSKTPERVDELERRVADLEEKLGGLWPADVCERCGERDMRLSSDNADRDTGHILQVWHCKSCDGYTKRIVKT